MSTPWGNPAASVIVRSRDKEETVVKTLSLLRRQTVDPEIILVDSGSRDRTVELARGLCDRLIELPPHAFSYGRALNVGAEAASAPVHFSISAHCFPERSDWIERSLAHYEEERVAATNGARYFPDGERVEQTFYQDEAHALAHPYWGYSNHAGSWRASVWSRFPFDETLDACEDLEWSSRVLSDGWLVAFDPLLFVQTERIRSVLDIYAKRKRHSRAVATFTRAAPRFGVRESLDEWWNHVPANGRPRLVNRLNYRWIAIIAATYAGTRGARRKASP